MEGIEHEDMINPCIVFQGVPTSDSVMAKPVPERMKAFRGAENRKAPSLWDCCPKTTDTGRTTSAHSTSDPPDSYADRTLHTPAPVLPMSRFLCPRSPCNLCSRLHKGTEGFGIAS